MIEPVSNPFARVDLGELSAPELPQLKAERRILAQPQVDARRGPENHPGPDQTAAELLRARGSLAGCPTRRSGSVARSFGWRCSAPASSYSTLRRSRPCATSASPQPPDGPTDFPRAAAAAADPGMDRIIERPRELVRAWSRLSRGPLTPPGRRATAALRAPDARCREAAARSARRRPCRRDRAATEPPSSQIVLEVLLYGSAAR